MKEFLKIKIVVFLSSLFAIQAWALDHAFDEEAILFPIQPSLVYDPSPFPINPFKMSSFSTGGGPLKSPKGYGKAILEMFQPLNWRNNIIGRNYEIKTEVPYHRDRVATGFGLSYYGSDSTGLLDYSTNGFGTLKIRSPLYTRFGDLAIALSSKAGIALPSKVWLGGIGIMVGYGVGIDYYFNQWVGLYFEYSLTYNYIPFGPLPKELGAPLSYTTPTIAFGFKTTF